MNVEQYLSPSEPREVVRARFGIQPDEIVIGKIARLFPLKGHQYLVDVASEIVRHVPNVKFLLVGDGILRQEFERQISELGLESHFIFTGLIPPNDVVNYIHAMDMLVHTSVWEGLARVLPQALIAGRPVVSFDIDGASEVCIHDETGLLVPSENARILAESVVRLSSDSALRKRLGDTGRERFSRQFCHKYMTERVRDVLQDGT